MRSWSFVKGHGTENDFVLIPDRDGLLDIGPEAVRYLCDRRAGIGGDGLLRVVLAEHVPEWTGEGSLWFMDYRNADGSIAEMCGNGVRVLVRYLVDQGLASGPVVPIATRGGLREATVLPDRRIRVAMGPVVVGGAEVTVQTSDGARFAATVADVGNPHAVSFTDDLDRLPLHEQPSWEPAGVFPGGVNLEFVRRVGERHIAMRVHERGSGETRSCGTGTVAAAAVAHATGVGGAAEGSGSEPVTIQVDVPGGTVQVELSDAQTYLTGPAVLVAAGDVAMPRELLRSPAG